MTANAFLASALRGSWAEGPLRRKGNRGKLGQEVDMDIFWLAPVGLAAVAFLIGFYLVTMRNAGERTDGKILTDKPSRR